MNKKLGVVVALFMAVLVTGYSVSGTYAKYTEDFEGTGSTASIAKWDIKFVDGEGTESATFKFDLFKTISDDANTLINTTRTTGAGENAVTTNIIAPGTSGEFTIKMKNNSDVNAAYTVDFTVPENLPLQFKVNNAADWSDSLADITDSVVMNGGASTSDIRVEWQWPFEDGADADAKKANDAADTALGKTAGDVTISAKITATQTAKAGAGA